MVLWESGVSHNSCEGIVPPRNKHAAVCICFNFTQSLRQWEYLNLLLYYMHVVCVSVLCMVFSAESDTRKSVGSDKMRAIVRRLCSRDPHQFFQRLETLARYVHTHVHVVVHNSV